MWKRKKWLFAFQVVFPVSKGSPTSWTGSIWSFLENIPSRKGYGVCPARVRACVCDGGGGGPSVYSPVMFFVHQMVAGTEGHQVGVVGRRRDGHWAGAAHVGVAQLVGEQLELVSSKTIVVPQHMVVRGPAGALGEEETRRQVGNADF